MSARRLGVVVVVLLAVGYFPLAFTYVWHFFVPGAPRLQDAVQNAVVGHDFAYGHGSVVALRADDYRAHRVVMLVHTSAGALTLALAVLQYSARLRRVPGVHRWTGRTYLLLMGVSMAAAYAFLVAAPQIDYFGGSAFDLQLWVLASSTLASMDESRNVNGMQPFKAAVAFYPGCGMYNAFGGLSGSTWKPYAPRSTASAHTP